MFLGMVDDDIKIKILRSAKPAAWRGPKPLKIAIFEAIRKNEKSKKSLQNWLESQEECTRVLPKGFFGHQGAPLGGVCPPKEDHFNSQ